MDDISETLAPASDQLDAIDLLDGPRTFTVERVVVKPGTDRPVSVYFAEFDRPWKPGKNQRRVLAFCWGAKSSGWTGKRVTLFRDPDVTYGKEKPGGSRIKYLSHIDGPMFAPILLSQGRPGTYEVQPLPDAPTLTEAQIACSTDKGQLGDWWRQFPAMRAQIEARVAEIEGGAS